jgi:nicotinate phosphoribosyltransferase
MVALLGEECEGEPLLQRVMTGGRLVADLPSLDAIRARCRQRVAELPADVRGIRSPRQWPVERSPALLSLTERLLAERGRAPA